MPDRESVFRERSELRRIALARWENEGGAWCGRLNSASSESQDQSGVPPLTNAELAQLQIRVIALENLVIALLVNASEWQLELVRDMAAYISPRPGYTPHRLTVHAADDMLDLVKRAIRFRDLPPE